MHSIRCSMVLLSIGLFVTTASAQTHPTIHSPISTRALIRSAPCSSVAAAPIITSGEVLAPGAITQSVVQPPSWDPSAGRLEWGGLEYLAGTTITLKIITDACTEIQNVHAGPYTLTPSDSFQGIEPQSYFFSSVDTTNDSVAHGYQITVGFPTITNGSSETLSVTFVRSGGTATVTYSLPVVHVYKVWPSKSDTPVGTSLTELQNQFARTAYQFFGGARNSGFIKQGKDTVRIYDYDAMNSGLSMDTLGTWIALSFKADQTCQPKLYAQGEFEIDTSVLSGFSVNWVNQAATTTTSACVTILEALKGAVHDLLFGHLVGPGGLGSPQGTLTALIESGLPDPTRYMLFLDGTRTYGTDDSGELLLNLTIPAPAVEIIVPYDSLSTAHTPVRFPPGLQIGIFASGLGMTDTASGPSPWHSRLSSGPHGVPQGQPDAPGVLTVSRATPVFDGSAAVGQLLGRIVSRSSAGGISPNFQYANGCTLTVPVQSIFSSPYVTFGVNDTAADAQRLQSLGALGYHVRIMFELPGGDPCPQPQLRLSP